MKHLFLNLILGLVFFSCTSNHQQSEITPSPTLPTTKHTEASQKVTTLIPELIQFPSLDGLTITANLYHHNDESPIVLLCHQAGYNKFEYNEIAKTLFDKGYNCIAIDQRSGGQLEDSFNETFIEAEKEGLPTAYLDAKQDIDAALDFAYSKYNRKVILWGSSYSSSLALYIAGNQTNLEAVIAFSPGNYFVEQAYDLKTRIAKIDIPMFITSSKSEAVELSDILTDITLKENQIQFTPLAKGKHGSKALWKSHENHTEYWKAILNFLNGIKKTSSANE